jgi:hypothetical protein
MNTGKVEVTPEDAAELLLLYDQLPDAAEAAAEALRFAAGTPVGTSFQRFRKRAARVEEIADRIKAILG